MSVAGLKKQFYKASQLVSEKVGGAEGTKLDDDFKEMEKKVDVTSKAVTEVLTRTTEYLQPNPASRAKLTMLNTMSKIRGQVKNPGYPQSEGLLGESMIRYGKELGDESNFGDALLDAGEAMKRLAEVKDSLDIEVKQNFIDPLQNLCDKDLKEIQHHLKKLEGRRLDFDYKKKRQGKIPDEELRQALEKFEESKEIAETSMHNLLETDIEQVSQLSALVDAQVDYHRQAVQILDELAEKLKRRMKEASSRPKREYKPKPRETYDFGDADQSNGGFSCNPTPKVSGKDVTGVLSTPSQPAALGMEGIHSLRGDENVPVPDMPQTAQEVAEMFRSRGPLLSWPTHPPYSWLWRWCQWDHFQPVLAGCLSVLTLEWPTSLRDLWCNLIVVSEWWIGEIMCRPLPPPPLHTPAPVISLTQDVGYHIPPH
uniref:SH3 domain containing GRB2 like 1, endophilin A2 n=1 Tax=Chrysemys picta bellii TaxID=8478 RepID=A0A8C3G0D0_CHRPI